MSKLRIERILGRICPKTERAITDGTGSGGVSSTCSAVLNTDSPFFAVVMKKADAETLQAINDAGIGIGEDEIAGLIEKKLLKKIDFDK